MTRRSPVSLALPAFATVAVALSVTVVAQLADTPVQATDPRSLITGIVRSEDGTALAGAEVWLDAKRVTTDSDGRFSLEHPRAAVVTRVLRALERLLSPPRPGSYWADAT